MRVYDMAHSADEFLYSTGRSYVDLEADDTGGIWLIYAAANDNEHLLVARLDPDIMTLTATWSIDARHADFGNGFVVCGVLYLVSDVSSRHGAQITFGFDLDARRRVEPLPNLSFTSPYELTTSLAFNPRDRRLYAWDNGNQLTYPLLV